ncbi:MAG: protoporphyrinogen oxidase [Acidimicrobiales bacterium]
MRIAVVGGGITGLAAAFELAVAGPAVDVVVLEASDRIGGKILTTPFAGHPVDAGADAFLARHPAGVTLAREIGLADRLVSPAERSALVVVDGELRPLPAETLLGVPTDLDAVGRSGLLSPAGIERAAHDPGPPLVDGDDAAIGDVVRQRLGDEVLDRLVGPLVGGINAGDPDRLSVRATTPQLAAAAAHRNMIEGAREVRSAASAGDPGAPVFYSFPDGMGELVAALAGRLPGIRTDTAAMGIEPGPVGWRVATPRGVLDADSVLLAVPAPAAAELIGPLDHDAATLLAGIDYASVVLVTLALAADAITRPLDASGFLVPRRERRLMTACSWASSKWAHLRGVPDDPVIVRVSAGRAGDDRAIDMDDESLVNRLLGELDDVVAVDREPLEVRVTRWPGSFPQYHVGHLERVAEIESALAAAAPGLTVAGAACRGLGVPACIDQGRRAARATLTALAAARS